MGLGRYEILYVCVCLFCGVSGGEILQKLTRNVFQESIYSFLFQLIIRNERNCPCFTRSMALSSKWRNDRKFRYRLGESLGSGVSRNEQDVISFMTRNAGNLLRQIDRSLRSWTAE